MTGTCSDFHLYTDRAHHGKDDLTDRVMIKINASIYTGS